MWFDESVMFGGERTGGLRVRPKKPKPKQTQKPAANAISLADVLRGFEMADDLNKLAIASQAAKQLTGEDVGKARSKYAKRREELRKELNIDTVPPETEPEPQQEPEQNAMDFGPPPMEDIGPDLFAVNPATGRVE